MKFLAQFAPGQKAVAMAITPALIFLDHYFKLGISDVKVTAAAGVCAAYVVTHFFKGSSNG